MGVEFIYHLCLQTAWEEALRTGLYLGSALDQKDGFIHFSTSEQAKDTAARYFVGQEGLVLIKVRTSSLQGVLRWEPSRDGIAFPHLYRPLRCDEAVEVTELKLDASGRHIFPY